jgi:sugar phosphate isomerase/epimerase
MNRRELIKSLTVGAGVSFISDPIGASPGGKQQGSFTYCLNMATIRGHNLGFVKELETASKAGFRSVEIWVDSLQTYLRNGGSLKDARKKMDDLGIKAESAIGFAKWIIEDDAERRKALGHPSAKVLLDVFHLYKGGSPLETLQLISKDATEIFHVNDYPANIAPSAITDADRIFPGDGVAPVRDILKMLKNPIKPLIISLEVFNKKYYSQDALQVAKTGLAKMKAITAGV